MHVASSQSRVSILLLAAGSSSRLGRPKQFLPYRGTTLLRFLANQAVASKASEVVVVLGNDARQIGNELTGLPLRMVENAEWREGISSSIRTGLKAAFEADAILVMLCDQPFVTTQLLNSVIAPFASSLGRLVACEYASTVGVPALFGKEFFEELGQLRGDTGAKTVLLRHRNIVHPIPFPSGSIDIDTQEDLGRI